MIAARGGMESRVVLEPLQQGPAPVGTAAVRSIDHQLQFWGAIQGTYYGVSLGSVLLLAAAGLAVTFGVMGVINMAHGEMVMLGAYTTFVVQQALGPAWVGLGIVLAVPAAFIVSGGLGIVFERTLIRWLYGRPLETLLATWGLSLVLQQAVRSIFGPDNRPVQPPRWMSGDPRRADADIEPPRHHRLRRTGAGWADGGAAPDAGWLANACGPQNRLMAAAMGIATPWIDALTFGLGSGVAGMAGVALSQMTMSAPISANPTSSTVLWSSFLGALAICGALRSPR